MSAITKLRDRITQYSAATALLLGAYCLLLVADLVMGHEAPLGFAVSLCFAVLAALAAGVCLVMGDSLGPWPALVLAVAQASMIMLYITVLRMPVSTLSLTVQLPVLALYFGGFQRPMMARLVLAGLLLSVFAVVYWDPLGQLDMYGGGRNALSIFLFTWLCLEAGIFVQRRFKLETGIDELTGTYNRRGFDDRSELERARAERNGRPICVAMVDLDGFKAVNDEQGHDAGDLVLKGLAAQWKALARETDSVTRIGGDEFLFLLPDTDLAGAREVMNRLRESAVHPWSYGVAEWNTRELISIAIAQADAEMYQQKLDRKQGSSQSVT